MLRVVLGGVGRVAALHRCGLATASSSPASQSSSSASSSPTWIDSLAWQPGQLCRHEEAASNVVVGVFTDKAGAAGPLTRLDVARPLACLAPLDAPGDVRVLPAVGPHDRVAVVSLGKSGSLSGEVVRLATAAGIEALARAGAEAIAVDMPHSYAFEAAEAAALAQYNIVRSAGASPKYAVLRPRVCIGDGDASSEDVARGFAVGNAQNFARQLADLPANMITPSSFAATVQDHLGASSVRIRDQAWAEERGMGAFLAVARGSAEPPCFLEVNLRNGPCHQAPTVLVGKGVTFDSGGISIKPSAGMGMMRIDMGGAAAVAGAMAGVRALGLPLNVTALIPLCENMPSGTALRPGDVIRASNGTTIEVDNTDAEGRLILADALIYADELKPRAVIDVATLTGAMVVALGSPVIGGFSRGDHLWTSLAAAAERAGDPLWRMPLLPEYRKMMQSKNGAHLVNAGSREAGACTAAAFLAEFTTCDHWAHLDIAGVMHADSASGYLCRGATGKPTRALIYYLDALAKAAEQDDDPAGVSDRGG